MRILYIANIRLPTERAHGMQIMKSCEAFAKAGHDVELVVPRRFTPIFESPFDYYGITTRFRVRKLFTMDLVRHFALGFLIQTASFAIPAAWYARSSRADIIYSRDEAVLAVALLFGARQVVWESHDGAWNRLARFVARRVTKMVTVTNGAREFYAEHGIVKEKIAAIPNGIDLAAFAHLPSKEEGRQLLGISEDFRVALYVGAFDGWKGTDTLCEASRLLPDDIRIVAVGARAEQAAALERRYPMMLLRTIRPVRELPRVLAAADLCILPNTGANPVSVRFTCPLKLLAYMAAGKPIVASDLPSVHELTGDDGALLVPADDPKALAGGIARLARDAALGARLSARARERAQAYDWPIRAQRILEHIRA